MTTLDEKLEQAIALGRSDEWILAHHPCTPRDITRAENRIDAAHRGDNAAYIGRKTDKLDDSLVTDIMTGRATIAVGAGRHRPAELVEAVRRLAAQGMTDPDIGARINRCPDAVRRLRKECGIQPGQPKYQGRWAS